MSLPSIPSHFLQFLSPQPQPHLQFKEIGGFGFGLSRNWLLQALCEGEKSLDCRQKIRLQGFHQCVNFLNWIGSPIHSTSLVLSCYSCAGKTGCKDT